MKMLVLSDLHGVLPKGLASIIKKNEIEIIVCTGDIAPAPIIPRKGETFKHACKRSEIRYKEIIDKVCSFGLPFVTLRGNVWVGSKENDRVTRRIFSKHKNLIHKWTGKVRVKGVDFILFDIIYEAHSMRSKFTKQREKSNIGREKKLNKMLKETRGAILMSHAPPYGFVDKIHSGKHVGSKILLEAIKKHHPKIVLCGHIHEAKGKAKIGKSVIYNLGSHGEYKILNV